MNTTKPTQPRQDRRPHGFNRQPQAARPGRPAIIKTSTSELGHTAAVLAVRHWQGDLTILGIAYPTEKLGTTRHKVVVHSELPQGDELVAIAVACRTAGTRKASFQMFGLSANHIFEVQLTEWRPCFPDIRASAKAGLLDGLEAFTGMSFPVNVQQRFKTYNRLVNAERFNHPKDCNGSPRRWAEQEAAQFRQFKDEIAMVPVGTPLKKARALMESYAKIEAAGILTNKVPSNAIPVLLPKGARDTGAPDLQLFVVPAEETVMAKSPPKVFMPTKLAEAVDVGIPVPPDVVESEEISMEDMRKQEMLADVPEESKGAGEQVLVGADDSEL